MNQKTISKPSFFLYARPNQSLVRHIENIWIELHKNTQKKSLLSSSSFSFDSQIQEDLMLILAISHDIGKINPFFQSKVNPSLNIHEQTSHSYHTQIGAVFAWLFVSCYLEEVCKRDERNSNILDLHLLAIVFSILNHHNRGVLVNCLDSTMIKEKGMGFTRSVFKNIITKIQDYYVNYPNFENIDFSDFSGFDPSNCKYPDLICCYFKSLFSERRVLSDSFKKAFMVFNELSDIDELEFILFDIEDLWEKKNTDLRLFSLILNYYSILCDSDEWDAKSHIADTLNHDFLFEEKKFHISGNIVKKYREQEHKPITCNETDPLLKIKQELWDETELIDQNIGDEKIITISYPTGSGKTLAYLNIAMKLREEIENKTGIIPRIIYSLPFISITDQVGYELSKILLCEKSNEIQEEYKQKQTDLLTIHHHLAEAEFSYYLEEEGEELNFKRSRDFIFLWKSNVIVTTFVSFWNSILGGKKRHYLRFHRLTNSIIIFDEIQGIPVKYWQLISTLIHHLATFHNCYIIIGSATYPKAITFPYDWNKWISKCYEINTENSSLSINRYEINFLKDKVSLNDFAVEAGVYVKEHPDSSIMFVLNTKESARQIFDYLIDTVDDRTIFFLSSIVSYKDRKKIIKEITKKEHKIILVCTQVIEAGVDASFDYVFRDLAPLDSIIQVAGRCNRHNIKKGIVYVRELTIPESEHVTYHRMIYDPVLIEQTKKIFEKSSQFDEKDLGSIIQDYFNELSLIGKKKDTSKGIEELKATRIESLENVFQLIEVSVKETMLIFKSKKDFLNFYRELDTGKNLQFIQQFREQSIAISTILLKQLQRALNNKNRLQVLKDRGFDRVWGIYLEGEEWIYQDNGGLNICQIKKSKKIKRE